MCLPLNTGPMVPSLTIEHTEQDYMVRIVEVILHIHSNCCKPSFSVVFLNHKWCYTDSSLTSLSRLHMGLQLSKFVFLWLNQGTRFLAADSLESSFECLDHMRRCRRTNLTREPR